MTSHLGHRCAITMIAVAMGWSLVFAVTSSAQAAGVPQPHTDPTSPSPSQTTTYDKVDDKFSLTVSPTRIVVDQDHIGDTQNLLVVNRGQAPLNVTVEKRDFTGAADGTMVFADHATYSASNWVTLDPTSFTVAPGASQTVKATIVVAPNPEAGDHQVALVFMVPAVATDQNITINRGVGVPLYVAVPGPTDDSVSLSGLSAPGFSSGGPVSVQANLDSTGTVHRDFRGTTPLMLDVTGGSQPFPDFTVVRGAERDITGSWDPPLMCICHVTVSIINPDGVNQTQTLRVIVFPVRLAGIGLGAVLALVFFVVWRRRRFAGQVRLAAERLHVSGGARDQ